MQGVGKWGEMLGLKDVPGACLVCLVFVASLVIFRGLTWGLKGMGFATAICSCTTFSFNDFDPGSKNHKV